ncbi:MAG: glycoside hydrolase family 25 protein [Clostridiales bacterium]|nr:glycoside hydrolase family 25 protein [Clostridiales bacterium]
MPVAKKAVTKKVKMNKLVIGICAVVLAGIIITVVVLSVGSGSRSKDLYDFQKDTAVGIDVSEHNGDIDWQTVKEQVDFAMIRVGYRGYGSGKIVTDENAKYNLKEANSADIPVGVYFYTQAITADEAKEEAKHLYSVIKNYDISLPVIIDYEIPYDSDGNETGRLYDADLSADESAEIIEAFCETMNKYGYSSGVYASSWMFDSEINVNKLDDDTVIWVADYNDSVSYSGSYKMWQYTKTGSCDGVESNYVDFDYWFSKER